MALKEINVVLDEKAREPIRKHENDAGLDIYSPYNAVIPAGGGVVIQSGLHVEIPKGYVGFIKDRSSMFSNGILTSGTIDAGYTGVVGIMMRNVTDSAYRITAGDRIAQLVVMKVETPKVVVVESLEKTERGDGGFGSTGK